MKFWKTIEQDALQVGIRIDVHRPVLRLIQVLRLARRKQGFDCVFWLRVNQYLVAKGWPGQYELRRWRQFRFANHISPFAEIGPGLAFPHPSDIVIGRSASIGSNVTILNGVTIGDFEDHPGFPRIGNRVVIFTGAKVIKPIVIGDNVTVGALTLVNKSVPDNCTVYGIPPSQTVVRKSG
jgi:serine acetyltransferase